VEGTTGEAIVIMWGDIQRGCLPFHFRLKDICDRNDKSEPIPHLEDSVRIIIILITYKTL